MTYRGHVKNGQITLDQPTQLPEGAPVSVELLEATGTGSHPSRRDILRLPIDQRRELLERQSQRFGDHYLPDEDQSDWQGADIVE
jgi:hypothetical protein